MAVDMFMRVEGANGESKDSNHKEWSDIKSFSWGATQPGNMLSGRLAAKAVSCAP